MRALVEIRMRCAHAYEGRETLLDSVKSHGRSVTTSDRFTPRRSDRRLSSTEIRPSAAAAVPSSFAGSRVLRRAWLATQDRWGCAACGDRSRHAAQSGLSPGRPRSGVPVWRRPQVASVGSPSGGGSSCCGADPPLVQARRSAAGRGGFLGRRARHHSVGCAAV